MALSIRNSAFALALAAFVMTTAGSVSAQDSMKAKPGGPMMGDTMATKRTDGMKKDKAGAESMGSNSMKKDKMGSDSMGKAMGGGMMDKKKM